MRLIDADALEWFRVTLSNGETCILIRKSHINELPMVDAEPVRHGRWENYPSHSYRRCSICKMEWEKPRFNTRSNYCPNCGAKMDGERK